MSELGFRIRVLTGPLRDSIYPAADRIEIGRSENADIQLAGKGVSRQHATVMSTQEGFVLLDKMSRNGTWVEGERITEYRLSHGDKFIVDDSEFEFQLARRNDPAVDPPPPAFLSQQRVTRETVDFDGPRVGIIPPSPTYDRIAQTYTISSAHRFVTGNGREYNGNLLADIMVYRNLRLRVVQRGDSVKTDDMRTFEELDRSLRSDPRDSSSPERREFARFGCQIPGKLRAENFGQSRFDVEMLDVAVDGARLRGLNLPEELTGLLWLSLPIIGPDGLRCIVFTSLAAWHRGDQVGLVFSGAPSWATRTKGRRHDTLTKMPAVKV